MIQKEFSSICVWLNFLRIVRSMSFVTSRPKYTLSKSVYLKDMHRPQAATTTPKLDKARSLQQPILFCKLWYFQDLQLKFLKKREISILNLYFPIFEIFLFFWFFFKKFSVFMNLIELTSCRIGNETILGRIAFQCFCWILLKCNLN